MLLKRTSAVLASIVMGATAVAGSCMSASAADVKDSTGTVVGNGQFYAYVSSSNTWIVAPHGMDDDNIDGDVTYDSTTGTVSFNLKSATYTIGGTTYEGYIEGIYTDETLTDNIAEDEDNNGIVDTVPSMSVGSSNVYYLNVVMTRGGDSTTAHQSAYQVYFNIA